MKTIKIIKEHSIKKKKSFQIFAPGHDWRRNACLNFLDDNWDLYGDGYERAIEILLENTKKYVYDLDFLVYPIVFLMSHFIELRLKSIIRHSSIILGEKISFPEHHKRNEIWRTVRNLLEQFLPDIEKSQFDLIESIINEFTAVDPSSTEFRYPEKKNKMGKSLSKINKISFSKLDESFNILRNNMNNFCDRLHELIKIKNEMGSDFY